MKRILITGGAGFVGSSLALRLLEEWPGATVIALDNFYRRGSELNAERLRRQGVTVIKGDVREPTALDMPACDLVIDAAAEPSVMGGMRGDVRYVVDTNLGGTLNVLEAARQWSARLIFLSSSRVYPLAMLNGIQREEKETRFEIAPGQKLPGITPKGIAENFPLTGPRTLYGATKYASEIMVQEYASQFGVDALVNRCGVLAGPWQMGKVDQGVVALWVAHHHYGNPLVYHGFGGKQVRDALHVHDLAGLVTAQIRSSIPWAGAVYNIGGGREVSFSLRELTALSSSATGRSMEIRQNDEIRAGDVPLYITDTALAQSAFGWRPQVSMPGIIEEVARWIRDNKELLHPIFNG